jgi:hypothetical protein
MVNVASACLRPMTLVGDSLDALFARERNDDLHIGSCHDATIVELAALVRCRRRLPRRDRL